jgi:large subunit ribosomal protein L6
MSRIGRKPVRIPKGVTVTVDGGRITVKGPRGELTRPVPPEMTVTVTDGELRVARPSDDDRHRALHGLARALINNMVLGVTGGFSRQLEIQGVGYKAEANPKGVRLTVGFTHPVQYQAPPGIKISVENNTLVTVEGIDKELVGQVAAELRGVRPPEPYKGKGIRYKDEPVRRKAGKTGAKT